MAQSKRSQNMPDFIEVQKHLAGVSYPAEKDDLIEVARGNDAPDAHPGDPRGSRRPCVRRPGRGHEGRDARRLITRLPAPRFGVIEERAPRHRRAACDSLVANTRPPAATTLKVR
jgi:hypothetical protein